jgi:hypothetical protein
MSCRRLHILIPSDLHRRVVNAAQRRRLSASAWIREAIDRHLPDNRKAVDTLEQLKGLGAPTADIHQMLAEIAAGRITRLTLQ